MKYSRSTAGARVNILLNDHYAAIPYNCSSLAELAVDGVIAAGTIVPSNDGSAVGVLLNDVALDENPNGAIVVHGFIDGSKLPATPTDEALAAMKQVSVMSATTV